MSDEGEAKMRILCSLYGKDNLRTFLVVVAWCSLQIFRPYPLYPRQFLCHRMQSLVSILLPRMNDTVTF
jgi:hypothetical protein